MILERNADFDLGSVDARRKRHFGTRASAIPHKITGLQRTRISSPPTHSPAFKITAWGEDDSRSTSIKAMDNSCSSVGRRLVVVSVCKVIYKFTCNG